MKMSVNEIRVGTAGFLYLKAKACSSVVICVNSYEEEQNMTAVEDMLESTLQCPPLSKKFPLQFLLTAYCYY
jgi:hypothetical protein